MPIAVGYSKKKKGKFPTREEFASGFPQIKIFPGGGVGAQIGDVIHPMGYLSSTGKARIKAIRRMEKDKK